MTTTYVKGIIANSFPDWLRTRISERCALCGLACGHGEVFRICKGCNLALARINHPCINCGLPLISDRASICGHCLRQPPAFSRLVSPFVYTEPINTLITGFKHQGNLNKGQVLADLLSAELHANPENLSAIDGLIPIPLHRRRLRQRGFNQSVEIARVLGRRLKLPVHVFMLERCRETKSQQGLDAKQRRQNLNQAFTVNRAYKNDKDNRIAGKRWVLIDDVVTTSATAHTASIQLLDAGARDVHVWAIARTI